MKKLSLPFFNRKSETIHKHLPIDTPPYAWRFLIAACFSGILAAALLGSYFFYRIAHDRFLDTGTAKPSSPELIARAKLDAVLERFRVRAERFAAVNDATAGIVDPSR